MKDKKSFSTKYIDVLDGIRAISVIIVLIFHFWQQTWIFPVIKTPFLSFIGITRIDFTPFARVGYLFVDMMILISGMLLFLPVARNMLYGEPLSKWRTYYKKRAIRILPSYLFCIIVLFIYTLATGGYDTPADAARDIISHLFFMHMWKIKTYLSTKLNVVLWTLAVEVWFYILFPILAVIIKRRRKENSAVRPLIRAGIIAAVMILLSFGFIYGYVLNSGSAFSDSVDAVFAKLSSDIRSSYLSMVINQLLAFLGVYAVGMLGAIAYTALAGKLKSNVIIAVTATLLSVGFGYLITQMVKSCSYTSGADAQVWQITMRLPLALVFMGFILSTAFAARWYRFLFSNRLMRFLSIISYNLYIWHQWLCVQIKNVWRIPAWEGEDPPNMWVSGEYTQAQREFGKVWSAKYAAVITIAAFAAAILVTYLIERPAADLLNGKPSIYNGKLRLIAQERKKKRSKKA